MFTDVAGYTALMQRDEEAARVVRRRHREALETAVAAHGGDLLQYLGDGSLTMFPSVVEAVRAALELQREVREEPLVPLRIGIHQGDISYDTQGAYGDSLNVASRIQSLATPGSILISAKAYDEIKNQGDLSAAPLGEFHLKNVRRPMAVYAVVADWVVVPAREELSDGSSSGGSEAVDGGLEMDPDVSRTMLQDELAPLQLLDKAASGGMGEIYLARDPSLRRTLAVKVLRKEMLADSEAHARFRREAQIIAGLSHPNVLSVHSVGELGDGRPYFVMDYIDGGSLQDRLDSGGPLSVPEVRRILGEVASALAAAHRRGVVHRDIKASNVLYHNDSGRSLVSDWGIAGIDPTAELSPDVRLTTAGAVIGSPKYMSPEQLAGDEVGPESDVYSLGLLAFELLTGDGPFPGETPRGLMVSHLREDPPALTSVRGDVDPELSSLIDQCLAKDPAHRPSSGRIAMWLAPSSAHRLEWPPPGLDSLLGKGRRIGMWALVGTALTSLPMVVALSYPLPDLARYEPGSLLAIWLALLIGAVAGAAIIVFAALEALRAGWAWVRALEHGYGWLTLMEVAADHRGDTGVLMTGGREYVALGPGDRRRLRLLRMAGAAAPLAAVVALSLSHPIAGWLADAGAGDGLLLTVLYVPALALLLLGVAAELVEEAKVGGPRAQLRRRRSPTRSIGRLVDAWHSNLEDQSDAVPVGPDVRGRRWLGWTVTAATLLVLGAGLVATLPIAAMSVIGPIAVANVVPRFSITQQRIQELQVGRPYRLPPDSAIDAPRAAFLIDSIVGRIPTEAGDSAWVNRPDAALIAGSPLVANGPLGACGAGRTRCGTDMIHPDSALIVAARGLTEEEQEYLGSFGHNPTFPLFSRLARASGLDETLAMAIAAGRPLVPDGTTWYWYDLPVLRYPGIREIGYQKVGYAASQYASGDFAGAEKTLRELISFGLLVTDDGTTPVLGIIGVVLGNMGVENLRLLYTLTGRPEEAASLQPIVGSSIRDDLDLGDTQARSFEATLRDPRVIRQIKFALVLPFLYAETCTSPRGLMSGPRGETMELLEGPLRAELVRYPLEAQIYDQMLDWQSILPQRPPGGWGQAGPAMRLAWRVARLTGNQRLAACIVASGGVTAQ